MFGWQDVMMLMSGCLLACRQAAWHDVRSSMFTFLARSV